MRNTILEIEGVDHLNINVTHLKTSQDFYQSFFGLKIFEEGKSSTGNPYSIVGLPHKLFLCLYEGRNEKDNQEESTLNHFGIHIKNFDVAIRNLENAGVPLLYGGVIQYPTSKSAYIADPDGNEVELSEVFGGGFH